MKKPSPEPKIKEFESSILGLYIDYSPARLREIADKMEKDKIIHINIDIDQCYGEPELACFEKRSETQKEALQRYKSELKIYNFDQKSKQREKERIIEEAKKLGMKFSND